MKKNRINNILYALLLALFSVSTVAHAQNIIPKPRKAQMNDGAFNINSRTRVVVADSNPLFMEIAEDFANTVKGSTGYALTIEQQPATETGQFVNTIVLSSYRPLCPIHPCLKALLC